MTWKTVGFGSHSHASILQLFFIARLPQFNYVSIIPNFLVYFIDSTFPMVDQLISVVGRQ